MSFVELSVSKTGKQSCFAGDRTGTAEPDDFHFLWPLTDRTAELFSVLPRLRTNTRLLFTTFVYCKKSSGTGFSVVGFLPTKWYEQTNRFCGGNFLFKAASHCLFKSGSSGIRCSLYGGAFLQQRLGVEARQTQQTAFSCSRSPRSLHHYLADFVAPWPSCVRVCVHPCCMH